MVAHLKPAEINVSASVEPLEDLVGVLLNAVLDVHLAAGGVYLLAGQREVVPAHSTPHEINTHVIHTRTHTHQILI